jgi:hypothetical protein
MPVEVQVGDDALVPQRAQHDAFGPGMWSGFSPIIGDAGEQGVGVGGGGFGAKNDDHELFSIFR